MRIILEGVDKSGKSTLLEKMKNQYEFGIAIKNMIKPRDISMAETDRIMEMYEKIEIMTRDFHNNTTFILDRYYQSELVYSTLRGNDRLLDEKFMVWTKDMDKSLKHDTLLILIETDAKTVAERFKKCNEDFVKEEQIEMLQERYRQVFEMSLLPKVKLDTTKLGIEKSLLIIKDELYKLKNQDRIEGVNIR